MERHDRDLAQAFDGQAARFERAPVQSDKGALSRLVAAAALPAGSSVLDAGCGPGLVAEAFLEAGHDVTGVDLSAEMVRRARERCARFGARARFDQGSALQLEAGARFDAAVSRLVLHHVTDPLAFVRAQAARVRPGGVLVASDHSADPDPGRRRWHGEIERARDRTHVRSLTAGELLDLLAAAGAEDLTLSEERFTLDFDEWFDRGTPTLAKEEVRRMLLGGAARGCEPELRADGGVTMHCWRATARGLVSGRR